MSDSIAHETGNNERAMELIGRALGIRPAHALFLNNRGLAHLAGGRLREAETDFRRAVKLRPQFAKAHNNLGMLLQSMPRLDEVEGCYRGVAAPQTRYSPGGAELLVQLEQHVAGRLIVHCEPKLIRLMQSGEGVDEVFSKAGSEPLNYCDCHCPMMRRPLLFQTRLETIPAQESYLHVTGELRQKWA